MPTIKRRPRLNPTPKVIAAIVADYQSGIATPELADKYGCSEVTILYHLKRQNVEIVERRFHYARREKNLVDWSPLDGIKADNRGRGYSLFTAEEAARIRRFYMNNKYVATRMIAARIGGNTSTLHRIMANDYNGFRPAKEGE